jgi:hypothetical protein
MKDRKTVVESNLSNTFCNSFRGQRARTRLASTFLFLAFRMGWSGNKARWSKTAVLDLRLNASTFTCILIFLPLRFSSEEPRDFFCRSPHRAADSNGPERSRLPEPIHSPLAHTEKGANFGVRVSERQQDGAHVACLPVWRFCITVSRGLRSKYFSNERSGIKRRRPTRTESSSPRAIA